MSSEIDNFIRQADEIGVMINRYNEMPEYTCYDIMRKLLLSKQILSKQDILLSAIHESKTRHMTDEINNLINIYQF